MYSARCGRRQQQLRVDLCQTFIGIDGALCYVWWQSLLFVAQRTGLAKGVLGPRAQPALIVSICLALAHEKEERIS